MKSIPEFEFDISQATQYIFESELAQKAFEQPPFCSFTNICRDVIGQISKLANNCNMPEFTNHGLQHICSMVKRATEWGVDAGWLAAGSKSALDSKEAGYLLLALMLHDIGMLSQDPKELPDGQTFNMQRGFADVAGWVRRTHVKRLPKLVKGLLKDYLATGDVEKHLDVIIRIAASHNFWPWDAEFAVPDQLCAAVGLDKERAGALNAIVAVCDLLDEDSNRCDSVTLLEHKYGSTVNRAHWYRHALTVAVEGVKKRGVIDITFRNLPDTPEDFYLVFRALRNHFRLVQLYNECLSPLKAQIKQINFYPGSGMPDIDSVSERLKGWKKDVEFCYCMTARLLETFMPEARNEASNSQMRLRLNRIGTETMDLSQYEDFLHPKKPYIPEEKLLYKILEELERKNGKKAQSEIDRLNEYAQSIVEQAYLSGEIGKVKNLCMLLLEQGKEYITTEKWYWLYAYMLELYERKMDCEFIEERKPSKKPYSMLIDLIWQMMQTTDEAILRDAEYMEKMADQAKKIDYRALKQDGSTEILIKLLIDVLYYYPEERFSAERNGILDELCNAQPYYAQMVRKEQNRLEYQRNPDSDKRGKLEPQEKMLADAWKAYKDMDMAQLDNCLGQISAKLERSSHYYIAFQKLWNMTSWQRQRCAEEKEEMADSPDSMQEEATPIEDIDRTTPNKKLGNLTDSKREEKTERYRLQQQEKDNPRNSMHVKRMSDIESMIDEMELEYAKGKPVYEKDSIERLLFLEKMYALRRWDIVELIQLSGEAARYHKLLGLSVYASNDWKKKYRDKQLCKAVLGSVEGQLGCAEPKKEGYWIGIVADMDVDERKLLMEQLLHWQEPIGQAIIRSWLEELGYYAPENCLDSFIDWIVTYCGRPMDSIVVYYALPMTVCRPLFDRNDMTEERWKRLEALFSMTLKNEFYWRSDYALCKDMLKHISSEEQLTVLHHAADCFEEKPFYANLIINIALEVGRNNPDLSQQCAEILLERQKKYPDNVDYEKYSMIVSKHVIRELPKPDTESIRKRLEEIFQKREKVESVRSSRTISMFDEASELLNNENWKKAEISEVNRLIEIIVTYYEKNHNRLMANEISELYRMIYLLAKKEECIPEILSAGFRMNACLEDIKQYRILIENNQARMPLPTNLNNGHAYGFMMLVDNLAAYLSEEQLAKVGEWTNRTFAYAEEICEYHYAYFWIYLHAAARRKGNARLEELAQMGMAQLNLKLAAQLERSYEKKNDILMNVLSAWKSYLKIQEGQDAPMDCSFPEELQMFREASKTSWFREKQMTS